MNRVRRHRLLSLGASAARTARPTVDRCRDDGAAVHCRCGVRVHRSPARAMGFEQQIALASDRDWGWPAAEPSSLSWPSFDAGHSAAMAVAAAVDPVALPATPGAAIANPPAPAAPAPSAIGKPTPLADPEAEDDIAELMREKGIAPPAPAADQPAPPALEPPPAPAHQEQPAPVEDRHAIFGHLGRSMPHATSFQLGRFDVDQHFDMLEQGLGGQPANALSVRSDPPAGSRDLHELDVLSEITALSEAAGVRPIEAEDRNAFLRKVVSAQGVSLAGLEQSHDEDQEGEQDEAAPEEETTGTDSEEQEHSAFPETDESEETAPAENEDG